MGLPPVPDRVMIDCSRGGVLKQSSVFTLMRQCALMGVNMIQLYTEDTYEMEGETFFGYLRGGYTKQELISMDDYAFALGIELVPCIQTLGHLGQILQWPKYHVYRDTNEVLLANWDETYNLIEKMITTISSPLRSKRIHIGLDEAAGVGEGRYRQIFGYEDPTRVFLNHLKRVQDICKKLDLQPMIWSDSTLPLSQALPVFVLTCQMSPVKVSNLWSCLLSSSLLLGRNDVRSSSAIHTCKQEQQPCRILRWRHSTTGGYASLRHRSCILGLLSHGQSVVCKQD